MSVFSFGLCQISQLPTQYVNKSHKSKENSIKGWSPSYWLLQVSSIVIIKKTKSETN